METLVRPEPTPGAGETGAVKPETVSEATCGEGRGVGGSPSRVGPPPHKGGTDMDERVVLLDRIIPPPLRHT